MLHFANKVATVRERSYYMVAGLFESSCVDSRSGNSGHTPVELELESPFSLLVASPS